MISPRNLELLGILQEECAEVIKIISKIRRFGDDSNDNGRIITTNKERLVMELMDTAIVIENLSDYLEGVGIKFSNGFTAQEYYEFKQTKLESYMTNKKETQ